MSFTLDRQKLSRAPFANVVRLARSLGLETAEPDCTCEGCRDDLIERLDRLLNGVRSAWPPRKLER